MEKTTKTYEVRIYAYIDATSPQEAEELYEQGEYFVDYHEIVDYDENGFENVLNQWDIEGMVNNG
jgi:hypothetical protein